MNDSRLKNYAVTAGGAAALAATGLAGADIKSSGGPVDITSSDVLFTLLGQDVNVWNTSWGYWSTYGRASAGIVLNTLSMGSFAIVNSGSSIGLGFSGMNYVSRSRTFDSSVMDSSSFGMPIGTSLLLGISISDGTDTFYGWIDYSLSSIFEGGYTLTINSWAYNDVAGQGIIAGQNQAAGSSAVPGLGGLAALAIGAAGVRSRRQRTVA